jgi:hypothetical protein
MTEAKKRGGRVVLDMDAMGFADITGFVCKKSVLDARRHDIESLIRIWYDTSAYVMSDLDNHSSIPLDYLKRNSATAYTLQQYKDALSQEYFPRSIQEANRELVARTGRYSHDKIGEDVIAYLGAVRHMTNLPAIPQFIDLQ